MMPGLELGVLDVFFLDSLLGGKYFPQRKYTPQQLGVFFERLKRRVFTNLTEISVFFLTSKMLGVSANEHV